MMAKMSNGRNAAMFETELASSLSVLPSPFEVVPRFHRSKQSQLEITPIRRFQKLAIELLPKFQISNNTHNITWIEVDDHVSREWGVTNYYIKIQKPNNSASYKVGILFHYKDRIYGISHLKRDSKLKSFKDLKDEIIEERVPDIHEVDAKELEESNDLDLSTFSMRPPAKEKVRSSPLKDSTEEDPFYYLSDKYYTSLYSSADLMFFAKSAFGRLQVLCGGSSVEIEKALSLLTFDIDALNYKYEKTCEKFFSKSTPTANETETYYRNKFLSDNVFASGESELALIKQRLKIREIKLQLIVFMELIILQEQKKDTLSPKTTSKAAKKPSLVRKKNKMKTLVPTLVGTVIDDQSISKEITTMSSLESNKSRARKYLDMLIVLDSLDSSDSMKVHQINSERTHSDIIDFLANIIVPFYYKKLPTLCKELIKTVKGVSMKRRPPKKKAEKVLPALEPGIKLPTKLADPGPISLIKKTKSTLDGFLDEKPALKRSTSMISSTKLLEKRTIDFSSKPLSQQSSSEVSSFPKLSVKNKGIFGTAAPLKAKEDIIRNSICEIGETPVKKQKSVPVDFAGGSKTNVKAKLLEVSSTPDGKVSGKTLEVIGSEERTGISSSPLSLRRKPSSNNIDDNAMVTSPELIPSSPPALIPSSPFRMPVASISSALKRKQSSFSSISAKRLKQSASTTELGIGASTIQASPKPGERISVARSSLMETWEATSRILNGSPYVKPKKST